VATSDAEHGKGCADLSARLVRQGQARSGVEHALREFKADPTRFKQDFPLTGDESRVAEVKDVTFPKLLDPVDDLAPTTVITSVTAKDGKLLVSA